jgi:HD-like signal output (HDOD) protein
LIDQDAEIFEITRAIELDQSIATKMLHIANSAFYGLRTGSVAQAVKYLGLNTMRSLVLTTPIIDAVDAAGEASHFTSQQLEIALRTNKILNLIYERFLYKKIEDMSNIAGLLHNIGKTLLFTIYRKKYLSVLAEAADHSRDILDAEREAFQVTHTEAGGYLLQWWDMPFTLVESALYHQNPFDERIVNSELVMAVHVAKKYAADSIKAADHSEFFEGVFDALGIDPLRFEKEMELELGKWKRA